MTRPLAPPAGAEEGGMEGEAETVAPWAPMVGVPHTTPNTATMEELTLEVSGHGRVSGCGTSQ